jgi:hypothetical protein
MLRHLVQLPSRDTSDIRHEADFRERRTDVGYRPIADMQHALAPSHLRRDFPLSKPVWFDALECPRRKFEIPSS